MSHHLLENQNYLKNIILKISLIIQIEDGH